MSDATSTVTARLKEEEGVWVTLRKLGAMATRLIGLALTPVRVVMSPLWKATAPLRSAVAYVFNRFPVLKVIPFLGAFAGTAQVRGDCVLSLPRSRATRVEHTHALGR